MTTAEYERLFRAARNSYPEMTQAAMREMEKVYLEAAKKAAALVRDAELRGLSEITSQSWRQIQLQLEEGARNIATALENEVRATVTKATYKNSDITKGYLSDLPKYSDKITAAGINNMIVAVNHNLIGALDSRMFQDGYSFSQRIWRAGEAYQTRIKQIISSGLAGSRDPVTIAKDIEVYVKKGAKGLATRWGDLKAGTKEWRARIRTDIDYNALRVVRSEMYASVQQAATWQGVINPAATGYYNWIKNSSTDWGCECQELADNSPYPYDELPAFPHPNCHPKGTRIMTDDGEIPIEKIRPGMLVLGIEGKLSPVRAVWSSRYSGAMIKINNLEATENHLLYTGRGWVEAQHIDKFNDLVGIQVNGETFSFIKTKADDFPSAAGKKLGFFRIIRFLFDGCVPVAAIDFDGQLYIRKSDINIKNTNSKIRDRFFSMLDDGLINHPLIGRPKLTGIELSYGGAVFVRLCATPDGIMCGNSISLPAIGIASEMTFSNRGEFKSKSNQISVDTRATDIHHASYLIDREIFIGEQIGKSYGINNFFTHNRAIVNVSKRKVKNEPVYNLTIDNDHTFFANGVASHNCLCTIRPVLMNRQEFADDMKRWSSGEEVPYIDRWYQDYYKPAQ